MVRQQAQKDGISDFVLSAIVGTLLGDGCIKRPALMGDANSNIRWNHGLKQKDYLEYKANILSGLVTRPVSVRPNPGYGDYWAQLATKSLRTFTLLARMVYPTAGCRKTVTQELLDLMTDPVGLAWWFGDDGSRNKGLNTGNIATNSFTEPEVALLCRWLKTTWEIDATYNIVAHSSTKKLAPVVYLPVSGFLRLTALVNPIIPESIAYKTEVLNITCPVCGKVFPKQGHSPCCSEECRKAFIKSNKQEYQKQYVAKNYEYIMERQAVYREAHRAEIRQKARELRASMTPEQREHRAQYAKEYAETHRERKNELRRLRRAAKKGDPEYERKLKEERKRYYQRKKADPVRYQHKLELERKASKKPERRDRAREYQRKYRAEHPEIYAAQQQRSNARRTARMQSDPEYRERRITRQRENYRKRQEKKAATGALATTE